MAERLTVESSGAGAAGAVPAGAAESAEARRLRDEVGRIKDLVKQRRGRVLSDAQAEGIVKRRETRAAAEQARTAARQAFEAAAGRESVTQRASDPRVKAAETAGTAGVRGADGLTPEQRRSIASETRAQPTLPGAGAPPATPEQAKVVLAKILECVLVGGSALDAASYAATVRRKGAATPAAKAGATVPHGAPRRTAAAVTPGRPGAAPAGTAALPGAPLPGAGASGKLTMSTRGALATTGTGGATSANPYGGLVSEGSFDAMTFNWDAFFARFLLRSTEDAQMWRKLLKEMRRLAGDTALAMQDAAIELLKMRQGFERAEAMQKATQATLSLPGAVAKAKTDDALSRLFGPEGRPPKPGDSAAAQRRFDRAAAQNGWKGSELVSKVKSGGDGLGREWGELTPLQQLSVLMRARGEIEGTGDEASAARAEASRQIQARWNEVARTLREGLPADRGAGRLQVHQFLEGMRQELAGEDDRSGPTAVALSGQIYAVEQALLQTEPRSEAAATRHRDLVGGRSGKPVDPSEEPDRSLCAGLGIEPADTSDPAVRGQVLAARAKLDELVATHGTATPGAPPPAGASRPSPAATGPEAQPWAPSPLAIPTKEELAATLAAQHAYFATDLDLQNDGRKAGREGALAKAAEGLEAGSEKFSELFSPTVDQAVQRAIELAQENRSELDAQLRESMTTAQGMLNQLAQLLGASRAR